jgi:hypothetical protein
MSLAAAIAVLIGISLGLASAVNAKAPNLGEASTFAVVSAAALTAGAGVTVSGNTGALGALTFAAQMKLGEDSDSNGDSYFTSNAVAGKIYGGASAAVANAVGGLTGTTTGMKEAYAEALLMSSGTDVVTKTGSGNYYDNTVDAINSYIGGITFTPGTYELLDPMFKAWTSTAKSQVTLDGGVSGGGSSDGVFVFKVPGYATFGAGAKIVLTGGAQATNVYWVIEGYLSVGAGVQLEGNFLVQGAAVIGAHASLNGRLLSMAAVTIGAGTKFNRCMHAVNGVWVEKCTTFPSLAVPKVCTFDTGTAKAPTVSASCKLPSCSPVCTPGTDVCTFDAGAFSASCIAP